MDGGIQQYNVPKSYRDTQIKWNGWGYEDSYFYITDKKDVSLTGTRYEASGQLMPLFRPWFETNLGVDITYKTPSVSRSVLKAPMPKDNQAFIDSMKHHSISFSNSAQHRIVRSHGHTVHEILELRLGHLERIPDIVVWPKSQEEVEKIIQAADECGVAIIPIGGGTSVSSALVCPKGETRTICSLDMSQMDRILWIDDANLICRAQAGIIGQVLEKQLNEKGYTCGHEPDSIEFSSLGGWVATRASGMKKNRYGNIEDLVVHVTMVTPRGVIHRQCQVPRISAGPDIHHVILGSEGIFGVITEVTIKLFPLPECKKFGSIVFPTFDLGVQFFREVARQRIQPASLRLVDNEQFIMGQSLKVQNNSYWKMLTDRISKLYVTTWKGFKIDQMVAATCVFEGSTEAVEHDEKRLYDVAGKFKGIPGGEENGQYGYRLTFAIAYLRDLAFEYSVLGESFETSVPWDKVIDCCRNVKQLIKREGQRHGLKYGVFASARVTQVYDAGACIYFYFGFNYRGLKDPLHVYEAIESSARDEILACGGSISHHHGVGKLRKQWVPATIGQLGMSVIRAMKTELDPNDVFANGNILDIVKAKL